MKRASAAQARRLALLWSEVGAWQDGTHVSVSGWIEPTTLALLKRGWIEPNGKTGKFPSGDDYAEHVISRAGIVALRDYLTKELSDG